MVEQASIVLIGGLLMSTAGIINSATATTSVPDQERNEDSEVLAEESEMDDDTTTRWAEEYGIFRQDDSLITFEEHEGELTTTVTHTLGIENPQVTAIFDEDSQEYVFEGTFDSAEHNPVINNANPGSSWGLWEHNCLARKQNSTGWMDICYRIRRNTVTDSKNMRYWTVQHWATHKSKGVFRMHRASIDSKRKTGTPGHWQWVDWAPKRDMNLSSCQNVTLGVRYLVTVSATYRACDKWDITKGQTAGVFKNEWQSKGLRGTHRKEMSVAYATMIKTPAADSTPQWQFGHSFTAK